MEKEERKKMETEAPAESKPTPPPGDPAPANWDAGEKSIFPVSDKAAASFVEKITHSADLRISDSELDRVELEKRLALIKAWEESQKTRVENKAYKKLTAVYSWENSKRATVEARLRIIEEKLEKKKAEYEEEMKNQIAEIHKAGEEKRGAIEAKRRGQFLEVEDMAAKYREASFLPKKLFGCFGG